MNWVMIYFWLKLNTVVGIFIGIGSLFSIGYIIYWFLRNDEDYDYEEPYKFKFSIIGIILICIGTLIPNSKQFAVIYIAPKVYNSEVIQNDIPELYDYAKELLKEKIEDLPDIEKVDND